MHMITVAGRNSHSRRFNSGWNRATAPSQWWQNPTLSFGSGYPQYVPSTLPNAGRGQRSSCYKTPGNCKPGYRVMGYDNQGNTICCQGAMTGPLVRNPPPAPTPYDECVATMCYDSKNPGACITKYCSWLKIPMPPGRSGRLEARARSRRRRNDGACCSSCANGGHCEGGCGANCTCGKEGPMANRRAPQGCWMKGKYVVPCPKPQVVMNAPQGCWVKGKYIIPCPKTQVAMTWARRFLPWAA
jgi:hypothetical protein